MASMDLTVTKIPVGLAGISEPLFQSKFQLSKYHRTNVRFTLGLLVFGYASASVPQCLTTECHCSRLL